MLKVTMTNSEGLLTLKMTGHASTAPRGEDLVCAGASTLVYTLAQVVDFMYTQKRTARKPVIKMSDGFAKVQAKAKPEHYAELLHSFYVMEVGFSILAQNYPDNVQLTPIDKG